MMQALVGRYIVFLLVFVTGFLFSESYAASPAPVAPTNPAALAPIPSNIPQNKPILIVRFNQPHVHYRNALAQVLEAIQKRTPTSRLLLISYVPATEKSALLEQRTELAIHNAKAVLKTLQELGINPRNMEVAVQTSSSIKFNEVHLGLR